MIRDFDELRLDQVREMQRTHWLVALGTASQLALEAWSVGWNGVGWGMPRRECFESIHAKRELARRTALSA